MNAAAAHPFIEVVGPYLPLIGIILGGVIVGMFAAYNRSRTSSEDKIPTVAQIWAEQRAMRTEMDAQGKQLRMVTRDKDAYSTAFDALRQVFLNYIHRSKGPNLTEDETKALQLPVVSKDEENWPTQVPV